jgi:hypothetical protein
MWHSIWIYLVSNIHILPRTPVQRRLFGLATNHDFQRVYIEKYNEPRDETWIKCFLVYPIFSLCVSYLETFPKEIGNENSNMASLKEPNPRTVLL